MAAVVFDFDGTLADMKRLILEVGNEIGSKRGWKPVDSETFDILSRGSIREGMKQIGIPLRDLPYVLVTGRRMLVLRTNEIELFQGITELVQKLHASGHELYVLSTNSKKLIQDVLLRYKLGDKMTVLPSSGVFGKAPALKKFMRSRKLHNQEVWLVGDELRDLEAAQKVGAHSIAVTWGLQHPDALYNANPDFVVTTPLEIFTCIPSTT